MLRVLAELSPTVTQILGIFPDEQCEPTLTLLDDDQQPRMFYRTQSNERWVLYKMALTGFGEAPVLHPEQR